MDWVERAETFLNKHIRTVGVIIAVCGLLARIYCSTKYYLHPDEGLHYMIAACPWHGLVGLYLNATRIYHPPLFIAVLQPVLLFGHSEVLLRLVPSICGALFPWFVMLWVQRIAGSAAALAAQLLLTFSPSLIDLSAEVRAYTLAFLLFSICLLFLEKSLDSGSKLSMISFNVFLYLAILTEYSVAFFVAAAGIYAILRLWKQPACGRLVLVWALGQFVAFGLYLVLYKTQLAKFPHTEVEGMYNSWLQPGFPRPHQSVLEFAFNGTLEQFRYVFHLRALAWVGAALFLFGLYWLWRRKSPFHACFMALPFCFACFGAIFRLFPYWAERHTAILDIAIAATVGTAIAYFTKNRKMPIIAMALPCVLIWIFQVTRPHGPLDSYGTIVHRGRQIEDMRAATAFLRNNVPADGLILTDTGTELMLGYYFDCPDFDYLYSSQVYRIHECGNFHFVVDPSIQFNGISDLREALSQVKAKYGRERTVWIVAGGWGGRINVATGVSDARPFGKAFAIFQESELPPESPANL